MRLNPLLFISACAIFTVASCDRSSPPGADAAPPPRENPANDPETEPPLDVLEVHARELQRQIEAERLADEEAALAAAESQEAADEGEEEPGGVEKNAQPEPAPESIPEATTAELKSAEPGSDGKARATDGSGPLGAATQTAALPVADFSLFYEELAPMGEWFETEEYGYVWQPYIAHSDPEWRPYTLGRWVDSDQGWTWISDEPFGWATYHYGRWAVIEDLGWVWIPGDVWAPAWVAWRNSEEYIGWCPMPPETLYAGDFEFGPGIDDDYGLNPSFYNFVPIGRFGGPVNAYCEPPWASVTIFPRTINVTRVVVRPSHVHCGGPKREFVKRFLSHEPEHYQLKCDPVRHHPHNGGNRNQDHRQVRIDKGCLSIFAPNVKAPWNAKLRPASCSTKLETPTLVRRPDWRPPPNFMTRFEDERHRQASLADEAVCTDLGQKVMQRQELLSRIHAQRQLVAGRPAGPPHRDTGRPGSTRSAGPSESPPRADPVRPDPGATALLNRAAAKIELRNPGSTHTPPDGDRDRPSGGPLHPPVANANLSREQTNPSPGNSRPGPLPNPANALNGNSPGGRHPLGTQPDGNRSTPGLAGGQHGPREQHRTEPVRPQPVQAGKAENRDPAPVLSRQISTDDRLSAQKEWIERHRQAREVENRLRKNQAGKQRADADARQRAQEAKERIQPAKRGVPTQQLLSNKALLRMQEEKSRKEAADRAAAEAAKREAAQVSLRAAAERAARDQQQRAAAEASMRANAERQRAAAAEQAAREKQQQQRAVAEAAMRMNAGRERAAAELAAREKQQRVAAEQAATEKQQRDAAQAAMRANADRQRAAAEQAATEKQQRDAAQAAMRANADRQRAAAEQAATEKQQRDAAQAAMRANADRQRAAADQAARDQQQRAAAEASKRANAERQRAAAAEKAARDQQQKRAAAQAAMRANADRQRAAAEKAARDQQQRAAAQAAMRANADRQRAAADQAARDQQQRAAAEASRRANAERQRAAAERAARERQRARAQANQRKNNSNNGNGNRNKGNGKGKR